MFEQGNVYLYSYLWAREAHRGEVSGRKDRPSCLLLRPVSRPDILFLFAITSQPPSVGRVYEALTASDCHRCGLREPAWLILDEYNISYASDPHEFASLKPLGKLGSEVLRKAAEKAAAAARSGKARRIIRN